MHTQRYSVNVNLCVGDDHRWPSAEDWPRDSDGWSAEVPGSDSSLQLLPSPYVSLSCISPPNRYDAWRLGIAEAFHLVCTVIEMISLIQAGTRLPTLNVCEAWHLLVSSGTVNWLRPLCQSLVPGGVILWKIQQTVTSPGTKDQPVADGQFVTCFEQ